MVQHKSTSLKRPSGMVGFGIVWAGQIVSVLASNMTQFGLTIWAYQETGSATALGGITSAFLLPFIAISPFAGVMVDRYNRKLMMMLSDLGAVMATVGILILHFTGHLQIWHLYAAALINGLGNTFQWPAYSAAISTMLPKEKYNRANGMMSLIDTGPAVFSPMMAGALLPLIGLRGILFVDVATFFIAITALLLVAIPQPMRTVEGQAGKGSLFKEAAFGFKYIFARRGLLGLILFFLTLNFIGGMAWPVVAPFILSRTGNSSAALGATQSAWAIGGVVGGLLVSVWGGFKRKIKNILLGELLSGFFGMLLFGLSNTLWLWMATAAIGAVFFPFVSGSSQAIWQSKVAPDVQGRVFATRRMIAWFLDPITPILAGALADYVTEPAMQSSTWLARTFGGLVGNSPGSGMALQFIVAGIGYMLIVVIVFLFVPMLRNLEDLLPDHDQMEQLEPAPVK
ncbi:MAG: MFS transporter [Anaerolineales bacterium]|nr:MFS transporter [Anaerolineales bacterium]